MKKINALYMKVKRTLLEQTTVLNVILVEKQII